MSAMRDIEWESCILEPVHDAELERYVRRELGAVPSMAPYLAPCPWVARSLVGINQYHALLAHADLRIAELIGLVVGQDNSCRFCFAEQRALLRIQGFPERRIQQLEQDLFAAELEPRERAALEFARRLSRGSPLLTPRELEPLRRAGWSDAAVKEIAFVAASHVYFNRVATLPALPPEHPEALPDRWWMRAIAPLLAVVMRSRMLRRGQPEALDAAERGGPYAYVVLAFEGLPVARALRRLLDDAFDSPLLPTRTKALVFAVVARGLGCPVSEAEATRLLAPHGFSADDVDMVLAHLASPRLDPVEAALLPLARDTIRYRPAQIQRRARAVHEAIGVGPFVEFTGVAALANAVCRLGVVTEAAR